MHICKKDAKTFYVWMLHADIFKAPHRILAPLGPHSAGPPPSPCIAGSAGVVVTPLTDCIQNVLLITLKRFEYFFLCEMF